MYLHLKQGAWPPGNRRRRMLPACKIAKRVVSPGAGAGAGAGAGEKKSKCGGASSSPSSSPSSPSVEQENAILRARSLNVDITGQTWCF